MLLNVGCERMPMWDGRVTIQIQHRVNRVWAMRARDRDGGVNRGWETTNRSKAKVRRGVEGPASVDVIEKPGRNGAATSPPARAGVAANGSCDSDQHARTTWCQGSDTRVIRIESGRTKEVGEERGNCQQPLISVYRRTAERQKTGSRCRTNALPVAVAVAVPYNAPWRRGSFRGGGERVVTWMAALS